MVLDNQNLQELWDWDTQANHSLQIKKGRLFFHFNPKLCLYKIERLKQIAHLSEFDNLEVAPSSNGDKVACKYRPSIAPQRLTALFPKATSPSWS